MEILELIPEEYILEIKFTKTNDKIRLINSSKED
jgi:hypothetical protein